MNKVIILIGQKKRCGTNFIGSTLFTHPDLVALPETVSFGEFNLFRERSIIDKTYKTVTQRSFGLEFSKNQKPLFLKQYGTMWLELLKDRFSIPKDKTIFIKSPIIDNIDLWIAAFPDSKIAILSRDGRDNLISSIKASNDNRSWYSLFTKIKKRTNYLSGRWFIAHAKHWAKTANIVYELEENHRIKKFKYEDLINSEEGIKQLLKHYDLKIDKDIISNCLNAPVVGSSFGVDTKSLSKPNWKPDTNKLKYTFTNKWKHWRAIKKIVFKHFAGKALIKLDYEKDNNW